MKAWLVLAVACSGTQTPPVADPPPGAIGSLGKMCGGIAYYVSSGNADGKCHAQVDDRTFAMVSMVCDDDKGNHAALACRDGKVACKAAGLGVCAVDADAVRPKTTAAVTTNYFAHRCGAATYVVSVGNDKGACTSSFDRATGARAMHCDDGVGDTADYTCRDSDGACAFTGSGICSTDEALVRKPTPPAQ